MENSLDSSSESAASGSPEKVVFKRPTDFYQAFEVSMEESINVTQTNKSDSCSDITSSETNKALPFRKSLKSVQHSFNVSSGESLLSGECDESVTFAKPQELFAKQNKSLADFFNVSFNETNAQANALGNSIDESVTTCRANPFKRKNESQNDITLEVESSTQNSGEKEDDKLNASKELQKQSSICHDSIDREEADSTTFVTKPDPFKKSKRPENGSVNQTEMSITEQNNTSLKPGNSDTVAHNSGVNETSDLTIFETKSNPFKPNQTEHSTMSVTKQRSVISPECNNVLSDPAQTSRNLSLDKSISKLSCNTICHEQSSINDDNLNNWMSDQSDEEMAPPRVPSLTANIQCTDAQEAHLDSPQAEINPVSVWEQKFKEIISGAEKKAQALKLKMKLDSPKKKNSFKKSKESNENEVRPNKNIENNYRPPKLLKPASFASRQLYTYMIKKLEPKYGIDAVLESENLVSLICDTVKKVNRRKTHQKRLIQNLKKEMAKAGLIETTMDFYEFIIKFLPYSFRVKAVPCLQPVTNMVYPPKDIANPFDKVL